MSAPATGDAGMSDLAPDADHAATSALLGALIADAVAIIGTMDIVFGEIDR
jgi:NADH:ubiquinone oxidoreductase subunit D